MPIGNAPFFCRAATALFILTTAAFGTEAAGAAPSGVSLQNGWIRALPGSLPAGGYFVLENKSGKPLILTGASSPACGMLMLHKSEDKGGMSSMMDMVEVPVPAGGSLRFAPGGYHLMCTNAAPTLKPGATVPVTLSFKSGETLTASFAVRNAAGK